MGEVVGYAGEEGGGCYGAGHHYAVQEERLVSNGVGAWGLLGIEMGVGASGGLHVEVRGDFDVCCWGSFGGENVVHEIFSGSDFLKTAWGC